MNDSNDWLEEVYDTLRLNPTPNQEGNEALVNGKIPPPTEEEIKLMEEAEAELNALGEWWDSLPDDHPDKNPPF